VQGEELPLDMRDRIPGAVGNIRFIVKGKELAGGMIEDIPVLIGDVRILVEGKDLRRCEKGTDRLAESFHIIDIRAFACFPESVIL
jgi:hypothetical protein